MTTTSLDRPQTNAAKRNVMVGIFVLNAAVFVPGHPLPEVTYFGCWWMLFRALLRGRTELDLVAEADAAYLARMTKALAAE